LFTNENQTMWYSNPDIKALVEERFGAFIRDKVNPGVLERDSTGASISAELLQEACTLGMTTFGLPKEIGGAGRDVVAWGRLLEEVGYLCQDSCLPFVVSLRASVIKTIHRTGRADLIDRYVIPMVHGARAPAFAYTDGTDAFSFQTTATQTPNGYVLEGEKLYVTGGSTADTFMVYARAAGSRNNDLQVFLVERDDPGVQVSSVPLSGLRSAGISQISLGGVHVPQSRALATTDGLSHVQAFLNQRRIYLACPVLGRMQAVLEDCIGDLSKKVRYGNSLTAMQNVQGHIGRMVISLETSRAMLYRALERQATPAFDIYWDMLGCVAKSYVIDQGMALVQIAQRLLGGDGFLRTTHYERYLRDFAGYIPGGGSQDTLTVDLGVHAISAVEVSRMRLDMQNH
jgi:alkylation response protein AidB-like acyl-CoA dehydrogenase